MSFTLGAALLAASLLSPDASETARRLDTLEVVSTRTPRTIEAALAAVTVIERAEIESSQAPDLLTLLRGRPGIDLARTGGSGQGTSLFLRGGNFNHVLVLIDGIRVASANTGAYTWEHLPLDQVERIEIVRGPRAAWYGSDAIGGVIAITTRDARGRDLLLRAGRYGRGVAQAGYAAGDAEAGFGVSLSRETYDGFSAQTPDGFAFDPDNDGYDNLSAGVRARATLGEQRLGMSLLATRAEVEFDRGESDTRSHVLGFTVAGPLAPGWRHQLGVGQIRDTLDTPTFGSRFDTRRASLDWLHAFAPVPGQQLQAGINLLRETGASRNALTGTTAFDERRSLRAGFVAWQGEHGAFSHEVSLRHDHSSPYGGTGTGQVAVGWRFGGARAYLSWGQGFRAPNFNELYSPGSGGLFAGNPDLSPERSRSLELGVDGEVAGLDYGARAYRTRVSDLIAFQGGSTFQAINIARAELEGVELEATTEVGDWRLSGNAGWLRARDADSGLRLLRRADRQFGLAAERPLGERADLGLDARYVGSRREFGGDLGGFTLVAARAEWRFSDSLRLGLRIDNLFDRDYVLARGFGTPGREWLLSLRWSDPG
jgi:vitamin B12 transporter